MEQTKNFSTLIMLLAIAIAFTLASCAKEEAELIDVQAFSDSSISNLQKKAIGKNYCLEFVFPISIEFIDGTIAEVESYEVLDSVIVEWFEDNELDLDRDNKPQLLFPIQVLNEDGEIIDLATTEELSQLKKTCKKEGRNRNGNRGKGFSCFDLVYPLTVNIGGVDTIFADKADLKAAVRAYKETAGDDVEKPSVVYPITIVYEDGTETVVSSQDELQALKASCRDSE
jgi:hypothetical protein